MKSNKKTARTAGFLYLLVIVFGMFALMYVRPSLIEAGNAAATASNIMASASLYRVGVVSEQIMYVCFLLLPVPLYQLFKVTNKNWARLMVVFVFVSVPMAMLNTLNNFAALALITRAETLTAFSTAQVQGLLMFFLNLYDVGHQVTQIFFGAWLVPLGYLVYKSGLFPRWLGILVILGGLGQLGDTVSSLLFPGFEGVLLTVLQTLGFSEILFCLWLLFGRIKEGQQTLSTLKPART